MIKLIQHANQNTKHYSGRIKFYFSGGWRTKFEFTSSPFKKHFSRIGCLKDKKYLNGAHI